MSDEKHLIPLSPSQEEVTARTLLQQADLIVTETTIALKGALEEVLEVLEQVTAGSPWTENYTCLYCGGAREHLDSCPYTKARFVLEENK